MNESSLANVIGHAVLIGAGATLGIDLWALLLRRALGVASLDYCMLGRWVLHMPRGRFVHAGIAKSPAMPFECAAGWSAHYGIGIAFALTFLLVAPSGWLARPTLLPALVFGVATVLVPFFTLQPAFGLGIAASRTPSPWKARLKSLGTHAVFGAGLWGWGLLLSRV
ncbi:MAG TPA: DUF2938 domain-containing protein [Gemmatimonadaceae bacterium]